MDTKKILIVGLIATSVGGWLQAETLTFGFATSPTSAVTFGVPSSPDPTSTLPSNVGTAFSGSLDLQSLTGPSSSATCNSCTLNFSTGTLIGFSDTSIFDVGSSFFYNFGTGGSFSAVTGASGSLNNANPPGTSGAIGASQTLATGSVGSALLGGVQFITDPTTMLSFSAPISAVPSANLSTILAAFGLGGILNGGTLSFTVTRTWFLNRPRFC
jgi:hypothetical protein